jgi:hypothetical protein
MTVTKNQFFLLLFILLASPFILYKVWWINNAKKVNGIVHFIGHTIELNGGISSHLVILFHNGSSKQTFNAPRSLNYKVGDRVPVLYQKNKPSEARVNTWIRIWGDTIVYSLWPVLVLLVMYFTPESSDPIIPKNCRIRFGKKPILKIVKLSNAEG